MKTTSFALITDSQSLASAKFTGSNVSIPIYDDGYGPLFIHRNSMGISGIVRARTWEDALEICEDEFYAEASETMEEIVKEYGFKRETRKVIYSPESIPEATRPAQLGANEKFAELSDYSDNGKLPDGLFIRWETIETPDAEAWAENALFQEAFGFRPNGRRSVGPDGKDRDPIGHGIYAKDLNGDSLDSLTPELLAELGVELVIKTAGQLFWESQKGELLAGWSWDMLSTNAKAKWEEKAN